MKDAIEGSFPTRADLIDFKEVLENSPFVRHEIEGSFNNVCPRVGKQKLHNHCDWLKIGKKERCGNRCEQFYCKAHSECINKGGKIPLPCLYCGVGVRSNIQLCCDCERETDRLKNNNTQRPLPFPCLCCGVETVNFSQLCAGCEEKYDVRYK